MSKTLFLFGTIGLLLLLDTTGANDVEHNRRVKRKDNKKNKSKKGGNTDNDDALLDDCINKTEKLRVIGPDGQYKTINCLEFPYGGPFDFCKQFDRFTAMPVWIQCPKMCLDQCFNECENHVKKLKVINEYGESVGISCKADPDEGSNKYCRQFDGYTRMPVWMVCPKYCPTQAGCTEDKKSENSIPPKFTDVDQIGCENVVDEVEVINKIDDSIDVKECTKVQGENSVYCQQFDRVTKYPVFVMCPLMCPHQSGC